MHKSLFSNIRPTQGKPLAVSVGIGLALVFGASAVAFSHTAADAVGIAITSVACSSTGACVSGTNSGAGPGVAGKSAHGTGVDGTSTSSYGLFGTSSSGVGVKAVSTSSSAIFATNSATSYATVNAQQTGAGAALSGTAHAGAGVYGTASSGPGVSGYSANNNGNGVLAVLSAEGVPGPNAAALRARATDNGNGVDAYSENYDAVLAISGNGNAIEASGPDAGNFEGTQGYGISAASDADSSAAIFTNGRGNPNPVLKLKGGTTAFGDDIISAADGSGSVVMHLDERGNEYLTGELYTGGSCSSGCISSRVRSYAPRESEPTMEDVGTGRLVVGRAYVALDPAFRNVVDASADYHVLVTPEGDSNGVFVSERSARGFVVRENRSGRSSLPFSYRIVGKPFGSSEPRLPMVALVKASPNRVAPHSYLTGHH